MSNLLYRPASLLQALNHRHRLAPLSRLGAHNEMRLSTVELAENVLETELLTHYRIECALGFFWFSLPLSLKHGLSRPRDEKREWEFGRSGLLLLGVDFAAVCSRGHVAAAFDPTF